MTVERDIRLTMRDGVELVLDLYLPSGDGPCPCLFLTMPYSKDIAQSYTYVHPLWWAQRGYVVAVQDSRGRYASEGSFYPLRGDAADGTETIAWLASQPFSNGRVATYGFSYAGLSQLLTAARQPPHLAAIAPAFCASGMYGAAYTGGAFSLATIESWALHMAVNEATRRRDWEATEFLMGAERGAGELYLGLPLRGFEPLRATSTSGFFFDYLEHPAFDEFWAEFEVGGYEAIEVPTLHVGGWYDTFAAATVGHYERMAARGTAPQRLLVGPWFHMPWTQMTGELDFGPEARNLVDEYTAVWFDHWLKGDEAHEPDLPPVRIFVMGINRWRDENEWPLARARNRNLYLESDGRANSLSGDGRLSERPGGGSNCDAFVYNPHDPVPSRGGKSCCWPETSAMGPKDERPIEVRNDVLCYTGEQLKEPVEVTGQISATIYASSTAPDTDFTVKLVDVHPCGRAVYLTDGILRARFRDSVGRAPLLQRGDVYEFEVDVGVTSNVFLPGHRIRVEVSSSNFPTYDRNPNTGNPFGSDRITDLRPATQVVYHNERYPSHVALPIVPI